MSEMTLGENKQKVLTPQREQVPLKAEDCIFNTDDKVGYPSTTTTELAQYKIVSRGWDKRKGYLCYMLDEIATDDFVEEGDFIPEHSLTIADQRKRARLRDRYPRFSVRWL
ncbi:hypothetical protein B0A49_02895 [Cryomyces minteri]|uniref:Uncharacterized protein n=1 Tax=Cryomyces minteri TaxID=331657 RepID=A0A4U0XJR7_9PEZI|nr:hypothetical protein B0A49_02895 [Cryomyces minteri]